jgi:membrane-associated phospholipid phosphatase
VADIFLSYSRVDLPRARQFEQALEQCGWSVFWDRELVPGTGYRDVIERELNEARSVIVLWSRASVDSAWVIDEAEEGNKKGCLISVRLDDVEPPLGFRQLQAATLVSWSGDVADDEFQLLTRRLQALSPQASDPTPSPTPASPPLLPVKPVVAPPVEPLVVRLARRHPSIEPTLLLAVVFLINYAETTVDAVLTPARLGAEAGYPIADAFRWFEGDLSFELHDTISAIAYYGYSASYFVIFPVLCLYAAWVLARRRDPRDFQTVGLAVGIDYLISLPFFVFFPVPERWSSPETEAMLLSDKVSDRLIELVRPMSGVDNCFPSFHVSLTVLVVAACFMFRVPMRICAAALGATIVLSTFVLGVHWVPDMIAGFAVGIVSVLLAWRIVHRGRSPFFVKGPVARMLPEPTGRPASA